MGQADGIADNLPVTAIARNFKLLRLVVLWVFCMCASSVASGVEPNRKISQYGHAAWRVEDGVIARASTITQTTDGYIWLGTSEGLMRFDGVRFVRWRPPKGQQLTGRSFTALVGARDGSLWIGTTRGLSRWKDGQLQNYIDPADPWGVNEIIEDKSGTIWLTRYRLHGRAGALCSIGGETLRCYGKKDGVPAPYGIGLTEDSAGNIWFGSDVLYRWRPGASATTYFGEIPKNVSKGEGVIDVVTGPPGTAWASLDGTGPELGVRHYSGGKWTSYVVPGFDGAKIWSHTLFFDRHGSLWVGTENEGTYRIHDGVADHYGINDGLTGNSIEFFFEDREGNLWICTEGGVDMFRNTPIITWSIHQGLSAASLRSVLALRDGSVWIANEALVDVLRKQGESTVHSDREVPRHPLWAMLEDHSSAIWLGADNSLMLFQGGRWREIRRTDGQPLAGDGHVSAIVEDTRQRVWAATSRGLLYSIVGGRVEEHLLPKSQSGSLNFLAADRNGGLWTASQRGGAISHYRDGRFQTVLLADSLGPVDIDALFVDVDDSVLVSTTRGLYRWKDGQLGALTTENGLPCDALYSAITDNHHALWIYARCGLMKIDAAEWANWGEKAHGQVAITTFDAFDGAHPGLQLANQPIASKTPDGRLWFINGTSAQVVDPDHLYSNTAPPPVMVEEIVADHSTLEPRPSLKVPALTRDLQIDYTALSYSVPQKVRFRYMLEGFDREWQDAGTRRQAFYTDLAPRKYRFRVIASNNDGVWNETGASLDFSVLPAWYQKAWFRALCAAALLALLWAAYRVRVRRLRREEKKLRDVIQTIPTFAWTTRPDGYLEFVNGSWQQYTGLSTGRAVGWGWQDAVHPEDLDRIVGNWRAALTTGEPFEAEMRYRGGSDGQYRWFLVRAVPLRDARGKIVKWYGTSTDIEDRKRAEQLLAELAHVNRLTTLGELGASLSHELKQPIAAAITSAGACMRWLERNPPELARAHAAAVRAMRDGNRAAGIIDHIRSLYKESPPQRELVDVSEIVRDIVALLRGEASQHSISMRNDMPADLPRITADRVQLQQVLMNLMLNAIDSMKETGGEVAIKAELDDDDQLLISVADTGVGLPAEDADRIFSAFFTTKPHGSGMGLAISRSIVESHGGRLWATANHGRGATFHFTLPAASKNLKVSGGER